MQGTESIFSHIATRRDDLSVIVLSRILVEVPYGAIRVGLVAGYGIPADLPTKILSTYIHCVTVGWVDEAMQVVTEISQVCDLHESLITVVLLMLEYYPEVPT